MKYAPPAPASVASKAALGAAAAGGSSLHWSLLLVAACIARLDRDS